VGSHPRTLTVSHLAPSGKVPVMSVQHPVTAPLWSKAETMRALLLAMVLLVAPVVFAVGLGFLLGPVQ